MATSGEVEQDLALAGIKRPPPLQQAADDDAFEIWEENVESLNWFLDFSRRWVFNPMDGKRIRLDDLVVLARLKAAGVKKSKRHIIMEDLLAMEHAVLEVQSCE